MLYVLFVGQRYWKTYSSMSAFKSGIKQAVRYDTQITELSYITIDENILENKIPIENIMSEYSRCPNCGHFSENKRKTNIRHAYSCPERFQNE